MNLFFHFGFSIYALDHSNFLLLFCILKIFLKYVLLIWYPFPCIVDKNCMKVFVTLCIFFLQYSRWNKQRNPGLEILIMYVSRLVFQGMMYHLSVPMFFIKIVCRSQDRMYKYICNYNIIKTRPIKYRVGHANQPKLLLTSCWWCIVRISLIIFIVIIWYK